jgi:hypothetical protein
MKDPEGNVHEYRAKDVTEAQVAGGEHRTMDCVDCHNRPAHAFFATPERAVDAAIARGAIPTVLPFARRETVSALKVKYSDRPTAERGIAQQLRMFYSSHDAAVAAPGPDVDRLVRTAQFLYGTSVFPAMNVTWGTHVNNLGHVDAPGCFRCHDDEHKSADGRVIKQDCELCHTIQ